MLSKIKASLNYHKDGFEILKLIHSVDSSAIPLHLLYSLTNSLYPYLNIFMFAFIIDELIAKSYRQCALYIGILIFGNFIFGIILDALKEGTQFKSIKINNYVQVEIRRKALELDYETLENPSTLEMINTADYSMSQRGGFGYVLDNYNKILQSLISIIVALSLVINLCFQVSQGERTLLNTITSVPFSLIIIFIFLALIILINLKMIKFFNNKSIDLFHNNMKFERIAQYFFESIIMDYSKGKEIRIYQMKNMLLNEFTIIKNSIRKALISYMPFFEKQASVRAIITGIVTIFSYIFVLLKVLANAISIGSLTKYVGAIAQLNSALIQLVMYNDEIRVQCTYMKHFVQFMKLENKRDTGTIPIEKRTDNEYELEFHDVSFAYPGSTERTLTHVSCKIVLKDKLAVVGKNGAGKTTFIKLLCRLYDPTEGMITLNGIDIKKYNYLEYLTLFSVVFQDFNLFAFPLDENVATSMSPEEAKVWQCLQLAGIQERIMELPEKLKTPLYKYDEGGVEISGGEAQKLAMARALYKDAAFVILDEPTAALDPISEYEIYSNFDNMVKDKTSIYISHRMSSCRFCNDILVFDNGKIIQRGSHEELIEDNDNIYAQLWNAQAQYYIH